MMMDPSTTAIYLRASTCSQTTDGQRWDVTRWLQNHGIDPEAAEWYEDTDARESMNREALKRLESAIFQGRVKTVVLSDVTRAAGSIVDGINLLHAWLSQGVRLIAVRQQFNFSSTVGLMVASLLFGLSQSEMETRRQRQEAGISAAKKKGKYRGRKPGTTRARPERAQQLREQGLQVAEIANALNVSRRTAARYLSLSK